MIFVPVDQSPEDEQRADDLDLPVCLALAVSFACPHRSSLLSGLIEVTRSSLSTSTSHSFTWIEEPGHW